VGRYGGDEFIILLPDTDENGMYHVAEHILEGVRKLSIKHENSEISDIVTVSIGSVSKKITSDINYDKMLNMADEALYICKKELGRNTYYSYS